MQTMNGGNRPGFYSWDVERDRVFSCANTAALFGLAPERAHLGLPVATFFALIHPADRERMRAATFSGREGAFQDQYRILRGPDDAVAVRTHGVRFMDRDGKPARHVGTIARLDAGSTDELDDVVDHCLAAYTIAEASGRRMAQHLIGMALLELGFDLAQGR